MRHRLSTVHTSLQATDYLDSVEGLNERALKQLHKPLCDDYAKLMRIPRNKVTPDKVLDSAPGALKLLQLRIAAGLVDRSVSGTRSIFFMACTDLDPSNRNRGLISGSILAVPSTVL